MLLQSRGYALRHAHSGWRLLFQKKIIKDCMFEALSAVSLTVGLGNILRRHCHLYGWAVYWFDVDYCCLEPSLNFTAVVWL